MTFLFLLELQDCDSGSTWNIKIKRAGLLLNGLLQYLSSRGSSREKLYQELGLEFLQRRRCYRKLSLFYKNFKENNSVYLFNLTQRKNSNYNTRNTRNFPSTVIEWNKLDLNLLSVASLNVFKKNLLKFQIVFLIAATAKESNTSQDYAFV